MEERRQDQILRSSFADWSPRSRLLQNNGSNGIFSALCDENGLGEYWLHNEIESSNTFGIIRDKFLLPSIFYNRQSHLRSNDWPLTI
jgi:hypothetical protein